MRLKMKRPISLIFIALVLLAGLVPAVAAYEAHIIDIKARVEAPATRTQGFWQTHLDYTTHVFSNYLGGNIDICWKDIYTVSDLMGMFWADVAKYSDNSTHRDDLSKERVKTAHQALAAILNSALPNGAPLPVIMSDIRDILCGTDINAINALGTILDSHNNRYDDIPIQDGTGIGQANPQLAQAIANIPFADWP